MGSVQNPVNREEKIERSQVAMNSGGNMGVLISSQPPSLMSHVHLAVGPQRVAVIGRKEGTQFGLGGRTVA